MVQLYQKQLLVGKIVLIFFNIYFFISYIYFFLFEEEFYVVYDGLNLIYSEVKFEFLVF